MHEAASKYKWTNINKAACELAHEVASKGNALVAAGISQTPTYLSGLGKEAVQMEFKKQVDIFCKAKVDFLIAEYYEHIEEMEWAIETLKSSKLPVCASMSIGPEGDLHGVSAGECAVRMAKAGADVVGVNCHFGPFMSLKTIKAMKQGLDEAGIKVHLLVQPLAFTTPDAGKQGFIDLPEFPFGLEPRISTRFEIQKYARQAYDMGVRYIGGCCGFEPYHIRGIAEELHEEKGVLPEGHDKSSFWGEGLNMSLKDTLRARANRAYWENLKPSTGRPYCSAMSVPDNWGVTAGDEMLKQKT